ncbi:hypothetical protein DOM22_01955 [Bdellovibrio sp. ZAP7]|uniref:hypothetical protein n=1 Tax=Bdellovibrio sp. ZAP7 TaxID=2231053 RepID=UPI0011591DCE|nr:hypothetical protein [Bdellovibrio sp. ZAP7]QDK44011.1 hypothetical protein DOM22_01955 [Bdellovibrio sp. ZAP7]
MKKLLVVLAVGLAGMVAKAETADMSMMTDDVSMQGGRTWVCGMHFKGVSKGFKIIAGKFKTTAYGMLKCTSFNGTKWSRPVKITMGAHCIGPQVGLGWLKFHGIGGELSLFNADPDVILGKYLAVNGDAAVIIGAGSFRAVKVGWPQLAMNMSIKLDAGLGATVGLDHLYISENGGEVIEPPTPH